MSEREDFFVEKLNLFERKVQETLEDTKSGLRTDYFELREDILGEIGEIREQIGQFVRDHNEQLTYLYHLIEKYMGNKR